MPKSPIPDHVGAMLAKANPAVIATLRPDGAPHSVATWYLWEGGRVLVNMDASRARLQYMRKDPRVALTVLADGAWFQHVSLRGRIVSIEPDEDYTDIDRISRHYRGQPYPNHSDPRVSAWIHVTSWHAWQI